MRKQAHSNKTDMFAQPVEKIAARSWHHDFVYSVLNMIQVPQKPIAPFKIKRMFERIAFKFQQYPVAMLIAKPMSRITPTDTTCPRPKSALSFASILAK